MIRRSRRASKHKMDSEETAVRVTRSKKSLNDDSWFITAIEDFDILTVRNILENKNVKLSKSCLNTALLKAVEEGKKLVVQLLLGNTFEDIRTSETVSVALVAAAERGYLDIVKQLVKKGVPVDSKNAAGRTALMAAVENSCSSDLISYLLDNCGADINLQDNTGKTVLMLAVEQWDYDVVQTLFMVENQNCDETIKDNEGCTAFDLATRNGSADLMNVFSHSRLEKMSPLSLLAGWNKYELVRQLIQMYPACVESLRIGTSPLTTAIYGLNKKQNAWDGKIHCSLELLELLLKAGADVNGSHACGFTPIMFAAQAGSEQIVQMLLSHGADVHYLSYENAGDELKRRTALTLAAKKGYVRIVEILIEAGADMYVTNHLGENALDLAIKNGHKACIQTLLKKCNVLTGYDLRLMEEHRVLDVFLKVKDRWDKLFENKLQVHQLFCKAIQARSNELVIALVDYGVDINSWSYTSCPLFLALNDLNMLRLLLNMGADINARVKISGTTALMQAALENNVPLIHTLLKYKANMYSESDGHTALTLACSKNKTEAVMALLDGGMDVNHVTQTQVTALWCAVTAKSFSLTETLIRRGASVSFAGAYGVTVLMQAIKYCTSNFSELIIKCGADVNAQDQGGETALFHALKHSITREDKVLLLLQHGADVDHMNLATLTPLMVAARFCLAKVLKAFLASKPKVNAQDLSGNTALHIAIQFSDNNSEKIKALVNHGADLNVANGDYETPLIVAIKNLDANIVKCLLDLGARLDFKNSPYVDLMWKTDIDNLILRYCTHNTEDSYFIAFMECMEALLQAGCTLHDAQAQSLNRFLNVSINCDKPELVLLLLQSGVGPNILELSCVPDCFPSNFIIKAVQICHSNVSPLCSAILIGRPKIIAMFSQATFFLQCDITMLQSERIRAKLRRLFKNWPHENFFVVEELFPENWSLRTWSKLAIQKAVGYDEGREDRMRALPIPRGLQDELLHKKISIVYESHEFSPLYRPGNNLGLDDMD